VVTNGSGRRWCAGQGSATVYSITRTVIGWRRWRSVPAYSRDRHDPSANTCSTGSLGAVLLPHLTPLPDGSQRAPNGTALTLYSFGSTSTPGLLTIRPEVMQSWDAKIVSPPSLFPDDEGLLGYVVEARNNTGYQRKGDSGYPYLVQTPDGQVAIAGVASAETEVDNVNYLEAAPVADNLGWINRCVARCHQITGSRAYSQSGKGTPANPYRRPQLDTAVYELDFPTRTGTVEADGWAIAFIDVEATTPFKLSRSGTWTASATGPPAVSSFTFDCDTGLQRGRCRGTIAKGGTT